MSFHSTHLLPFSFPSFPFPMTCQRSNFYSTICISVLFFDLSGVVLAEGFDSLLQLPRSRPFGSRVVSEKLLLHVGDHGALGDGSSDDTEAFKRVWKVACSLLAPSRIVIPPKKTFLVHPIDFSGPCRSKVTLQISGRIIAPDDPEAWKGLNPHKWLYFHGIKHLTVLGGGRVNGMGRKWWSKSCKTNSSNPCDPAPTAMTFHRCKYLKLQNLMVVDSQKMHVALTNCMRVIVSNLKVIAPPASPNTDGIHISTSRSVMIEDCIIRTGDDCISIVSNSSRINIRNIICGPGHGISIGSLGKYNSQSSVQNVVVDGALMSNTDNGVRIKTWQGGGGSATDIVFKNIWMDNVANPIIIDQYYCDSFLPCPNQTQSVRVANVTYSHIFGTSATTDAIIFDCSDESPCTDLYLEDVELVSSSGGWTRSLCWEAYGVTSGLVYPHPCVAQMDDVFIRQKPEASGSSVLSS